MLHKIVARFKRTYSRSPVVHLFGEPCAVFSENDNCFTLTTVGEELRKDVEVIRRKRVAEGEGDYQIIQ